MPIPFDQVTMAIVQRNQHGRAVTSWCDAPGLHRCFGGNFLDIAGPMGIGMAVMRLLSMEPETRSGTVRLEVNAAIT